MSVTTFLLERGVKIAFIVFLYYVTAAFYHLFDPFQFHPLIVIVCLSVLVHHMTYWGVGLLLMRLDISQSPGWLYCYKIQKNHVVPWNEYIHCVKTVLINQHFVNLPCFILIYPFYMHAGLQTTGPMPSILELVKGAVVCVIVEEILFYYSHRLFHHGSVYKYIHKQHHDFQAPVAIAAEYAHPIESIVSNTLPVLLGPLAAAYVFNGAHVTLLWFWLFLALTSTLNSHGGYDFPFYPTGDAKVHDFHHSSFRDNYGTIGFLDWLHGTDSTYKKHVQQLADKPKQSTDKNNVKDKKVH